VKKRNVVGAGSLFAVWVIAAFAARPVATIYPSGPSVPENLLRIEVRFSAPLSAPLDLEHVKLYDSAGEAIADPFLDLLLPSADGTRVTVLLHPARVKTGVGANVALGRALRAGSMVTLVVDDPLLARPARKIWRITGFDAESPQPSRWIFDPPLQGTRTPLVIRLEAPISSTAEDLIAVRAPSGQHVAGHTALEDGDTVWRFAPLQSWGAGTYAVVVNEDLEDPAGNRTGAPFEAAVASQALDVGMTSLAFRPLPGSSQRMR